MSEELKPFDFDDLKRRSARWQVTAYDVERCVEEIERLRAALGRRGAQEESLARLEAVETLLREQAKWTRGVHFKVSADGLEAHARDIHEALAALRGVGTLHQEEKADQCAQGISVDLCVPPREHH